MSSLFIKIDFNNSPSTDTGTRPYSGSTPLWNNSSIFLTGGLNQTETKVGLPTTVNVRVSNSSDSTIEDVNVDAYVMTPFAGVFSPNNAKVNLKGFAAQITAGSGATSASDAHVVRCLKQDPVGGAIPWTPTQAEFEAWGGHLCLVANCYADGDGAPWLANTPFDVVNDAHLGQRNISLLAATKSGMKMVLPFEVMPDPGGDDTALDLHRRPGRVLVQGGEYWLLRSHRNIVKAADTRIGLGIQARGGKPAVPLTLSRRQVKGTVEIADVVKADLGELAASTRKLDLRSSRGGNWGRGRLIVPANDRPTPATLTVEPVDAPGAVQVFDLVQRTAKGVDLGGLRVLVVQL